jgi:hypothetical protein
VNSHVDVEEMKEALNDGDIHVSTEALVITMLFLDIPKDIPKVVLLLPICSHDCISILETSILFIKSVIDESASKLVNIASDGDGKRRKLFNNLRITQEHLEELKRLHLFDQTLVYGRFSINYDPKHLVKRLRGMLISRSSKKEIKCIKIAFTKQHLVQLFPKSRYSEIDSLLDAKDKQNVPNAVKLLQLLEDLNPDSYESATTKDIVNEIKVFGHIAKLLLSVFVDPKIDLFVQLYNLAQLSFILLIIFKKHGTKFMLGNLYLDIQSVIQDAFVAVAYFKSVTSTKPLYIHLLGTDQLESLFSIVRTLTHARNVDCLELVDRLHAAHQVEEVYNRNDGWKAASRLVETTCDKSSIRSWIGNIFQSLF